jgi:hypothetical protein
MIIYTSNLSPDVPVRDMAAEELAEHVLKISENTEETLASKNSRLRRGLFQGTRKEVFHGFIVVPQSMCEKDVEAFSKIHGRGSCQLGSPAQNTEQQQRMGRFFFPFSSMLSWRR